MSWLARAAEQPKHATRDRNESNPPDCFRDGGNLSESDFAIGPLGKNGVFHPGVRKCVGHATDKHATEANQRMDGTCRHCGYARSRAIAVDSHSDSEECSAEEEAEQVGVFDMPSFEPPETHHGGYSETANDDRSEHDFQNSPVTEPEQVNDYIVISDAAFVEEDAE